MPKQSDRTHSWTTGDRFIFEVFCKAIAFAISVTAFAISAIAEFKAGHCHSWTTGDRFL